MKKQYKIWTGDGSAIDGTTYDTYEEAYEALREWCGWDEIYTVEHCNGDAVSCYATEEAADADQDGALLACKLIYIKVPA
jgi:hypothetical protein